MQQVRALWQQVWPWYRAKARNVQIGLGCGALVVVCAVCGGGLAAIGGGGKASPTAAASHQPSATAHHVTPTPTHKPLSPQDALTQEIHDGAILRGSFLSLTYDPSTQLIGVFVSTAVNSLDEVQYNAYQVHKAIWTGAAYKVPAGWTVSVRVYTGDLGSGHQIAFAYISTEDAAKVSWANVTPAQAWSAYTNKSYQG